MGYDMYADGARGLEDSIAKETAQRRFNEAVEARNALTRGTSEYDAAQDKVHEAMNELDAADTGYFRLNIWGMSWCRELMFDFGMCYISSNELPCPVPATEEIETEVYEKDESEWSEAAKVYAAQLKEWKVAGVEERPGIAVHKLGSNDGWIVTPIECQGAIAQWRKWCEDNDRDPDTFVPLKEDQGEMVEVRWWRGWLNWLERCGAAEGFTVH